MNQNDRKVAGDIDPQHDDHRHLSEICPIDSRRTQSQVNVDDVVGYQAQHGVV